MNSLSRLGLEPELVFDPAKLKTQAEANRIAVLSRPRINHGLNAFIGKGFGEGLIISEYDIHTALGQIEFLNDVSTWIAVSAEGHAWIENSPKLARERGFTKSRLSMTDQLNKNL